jgi:hypothetical protein
MIPYKIEESHELVRKIHDWGFRYGIWADFSWDHKWNL